jgi:hypothetical protein
MPNYPQSQADSFNGSTFRCANCEKVVPFNTHFTITALGLMDKGKAGYGRTYLPSDVAELSLWHVMDREARKVVELKLSEGRFNGGAASVFFCSADCMKNYLVTAVDELVARSAKA